MAHTWRSAKIRRPRDVVARYVQVLTEELADDNGPELDFTFGGSWRRGAEVIGDLDILIISEHDLAPNLLTPGVRLPSVVDWQRHGPRIANGDLTLPDCCGWPGPLHIDVWHGYPRSRGAMLCFFTGPMELNIYQRRRAKVLGLAFSQNGLVDRESKVPLLGTETEEGCYRALGMDYLTPEERQRWASVRL